MVRTGVRRVPLLGPDHRVLNILTQSMLISLFDQQINRFNGIRDVKIRDMLPGLCQQLVVVCEDETVLKGFEEIVHRDISGIGVVNKEGRLTGSLSIRDLRGIIGVQGTFNLERYEMSIKEYRRLLLMEYAQQTPPAPIVLQPDSTFSDLINAMDDGNIHRVFIVERDADGVELPTHVCTQRDVLRWILYQCGMEPKTVQELMAKPSNNHLSS